MLAAVCLVGCASANVGQSGGDDIQQQVDAPDNIIVDAPPDQPEPLTPVTLNESGSNALVATQIGCQQNNPATSFTTQNSYYRIFPLADFNITKALHVTNVSFQVEQSTPGDGVSQPAEVRVGTYSGTINAASFPTSQLTQVAVAPIAIPANATIVNTAIAMFNPSNFTIAPGTNMYVEIFIPDGRPAGNIFYIGSNAGTETHPSYINAADCGLNSPTTYDTSVGTPAIRLLIKVDGEF